MILVTKRRQVALIGGHDIYKIEDTMVLPVVGTGGRKAVHQNEARYMKMFQVRLA